MTHPYIKFEGTELWHAIDSALRMLEDGDYLRCTKPREQIIGFIHHQLDARGLIRKALEFES